jgi:hypothetical protein
LGLCNEFAEEDNLRPNVIGDDSNVGRLEQKEKRQGPGDSQRGRIQSFAQSFASVADPPFPNKMSLPPRARLSLIARAVLLICSAWSAQTADVLENLRAGRQNK